MVSVGYNPDFAPFTYLAGDGPCGLVIDRIEQVFAKAELPLTFTAVSLPQMQAGLAAGRLDALAAVAALPARETRLALSPPLALSGGAWFATGNSVCWPDDPTSTDPSSPSLRVVTPARGPLAELVREQFPDLRLLTCEDYATAFTAVLEGNADAAALNWQVGSRLCARDYPGRFRLPTSPFCRLPLVMAFAAGDPLGLLPRLRSHFREHWGEVMAQMAG